MKIAMLTNNYKPFVGGVPISVERQAQELVKRGHQVTVFAPEYEILDDETKKMKIHSGTEYDNGIRIIRFRTGKRCMENGMVYPRVILKEITQVFAEEHFDLIHTHHPMFVGPTALYLGRKYQLPVIYTYHTRYEDYLHYLDFLQENQSFPNLRKWMLKKGRETIVPRYMRWFTNQCDLILAPTAGMQKRIRGNGTKVSTAVFPTGLETSFYREYPKEAEGIRRQYLPNGGRLFCTAGRLEEEKNPHFLLQGITCLKEKMQEPFQVLLIGDGSMRKALEKETKELGIADVVKFLGNISNDKVNRYLQASDVFLFASKSETQGIVLAEAFAAGCPIVAVDASGVEDIVENGQNGFVTEENAEVWSNRVTDVLGQLVRMKQQAKITAEGYRSERLAVYEESLYERVISEKNAGRQEELGYEYEEHGAKSPSERIFRVFKTS